MSVSIRQESPCMYMAKHARMYTCVLAFEYVCMETHILDSIYVDIFVWMHVYMNVYM